MRSAVLPSMRNTHTLFSLCCVYRLSNFLALLALAVYIDLFGKKPRIFPTKCHNQHTVVISLAKEKGDLPRCWCQNVERFIVCMRSTARGQMNGRRSYDGPQTHGGHRRTIQYTTFVHGAKFVHFIFSFFKRTDNEPQQMCPGVTLEFCERTSAVC